MVGKVKQSQPRGNADAVKVQTQRSIRVVAVAFFGGLFGATVLAWILIGFSEFEKPKSTTNLVVSHAGREESRVLKTSGSETERGKEQSSDFQLGYGIETASSSPSYVPNDVPGLTDEPQKVLTRAIGQAIQVPSTAAARHAQDSRSISGRVLSKAGVPIPQIQLIARRAHLDNQRKRLTEAESYTESNADGYYQFSGLQEGEYIITLAQASFSPVKVFARTGTVDADLVVPDVKKTLTLYGTIQGQKGEPVAGSLVMLAGANSGVRSDVTGQYKTTLVIDGGRTLYEIRIQHEAYEPVIMEITDQHLAGIADQLQVDVTLHALRAVTTVNGQVRNAAGAPLANETVWLHSPQLEQYYSATTDTAGRFVIPRVESSADYRLQVRPHEPYQDYTQENVRVSGEVIMLDVVLRAGTTGTLSGKLVAPDGSPIPGFNLLFRSVDRVGQVSELRTDKLGNFVVNDAPAGGLLFYSRAAPQIQISGVYLPPDQSVNVKLVVDWGHHEFEGRVVDFANNPIAGATVLLTWFQQQHGLRSRSIRKATTDGNGLFRFTQLSSGQRILRAEAPGYQPAQVEQKIGITGAPLQLRLVQQ